MASFGAGAAVTGGDLGAQPGFSGSGSMPRTANFEVLDHCALEEAFETTQMALTRAKADFSVLGESGRVLSTEKGVCHRVDLSK